MLKWRSINVGKALSTLHSSKANEVNLQTRQGINLIYKNLHLKSSTAFATPKFMTIWQREAIFKIWLLEIGNHTESIIGPHYGASHPLKNAKICSIMWFWVKYVVLEMFEFTTYILRGEINEKTYGSDADCRTGPLSQSLYKSKYSHHFEPDCSSEICSAPEGFIRQCHRLPFWFLTSDLTNKNQRTLIVRRAGLSRFRAKWRKILNVKHSHQIENSNKNSHPSTTGFAASPPGSPGSPGRVNF